MPQLASVHGDAAHVRKLAGLYDVKASATVGNRNRHGRWLQDGGGATRGDGGERERERER